jgi:hypothetical protein
MKKILYFLFAILYILFLVYLLLPSPAIPPLPNSYQSTEPGDTGDIPGVVAAYYTNLSRQEVTEFYQKSFSRSPFLKAPLITYKLNHPTEYSRETIIDTIHSDFFEEIVHPLRESLFINGWTPKKDADYQGGVLNPIFEYEREGKKYASKITLYLIPSSPLLRVIIFHLSLLVLFSLIYLLKLVVSSPWRIS